MARQIQTQTKTDGRRSATVLPIAFAAFVFCLSADASAGMIVPWIQDQVSQGQAIQGQVAEAVGVNSVDVNLYVSFGEGVVGSSNAPAQVVVDEKKPARPGRDDAARLNAREGLAEAVGGASAPVEPSSFQMKVASAAIFDMPPVVPVARSLGYLREHALRLTNPPPGELLDPPKACV